MSNLNPDDLLPLEQMLKDKSVSTKDFPARSNEYYNKYWSLKTYLARNLYKWTGAGTSAEDNGVYTDHSIDHFNAVIDYAGKLLISDYPFQLNPYELFILLCAILLHDAGNAEGRREHEKKPFKILKDAGNSIISDKFEARMIALIASAHGGKIKDPDTGQHTSQDTISTLLEKTTNGNIEYRPKMIAAIVKFADEICEDRNRAASYLLRYSQLPNFSELYHIYASSITSADIDHLSRTIRIVFEISIEEVLKKYQIDKANTGSKYLIDEIMSRLEKMFLELLYCKRFFYEIIQIDKIRATVTLYDDDMNVLETTSFELMEQGYPTKQITLSQKAPHWVGSELAKRITQGVEND